jgi:hypothetical protein
MEERPEDRQGKTRPCPEEAWSELLYAVAPQIKTPWRPGVDAMTADDFCPVRTTWGNVAVQLPF